MLFAVGLIFSEHDCMQNSCKRGNINWSDFRQYWSKHFYLLARQELYFPKPAFPWHSAHREKKCH
jgi:hypothetical protein